MQGMMGCIELGKKHNFQWTPCTIEQGIFGPLSIYKPAKYDRVLRGAIGAKSTQRRRTDKYICRGRLAPTKYICDSSHIYLRIHKQYTYKQAYSYNIYLSIKWKSTKIWYGWKQYWGHLFNVVKNCFIIHKTFLVYFWT